MKKMEQTYYNALAWIKRQYEKYGRNGIGGIESAEQMVKQYYLIRDDEWEVMKPALEKWLEKNMWKIR